MAETLKGTCLCGGVEYEVQDPQAMGYCHCGRCQQWTGSSLAGVVVAKENFHFTKGEDLVKTYESELAPRNFCSNCGSSIFDDLGDVYFVAAGLMADLDMSRASTSSSPTRPAGTTSATTPRSSPSCRRAEARARGRRRSAFRRCLRPAAATSSSRPMALRPPVASTNRQTASAFGSHRPARKVRSAQPRGCRAGDDLRLGRAKAVVDGVHIGGQHEQLGLEVAASRADARSLSMTASTPLVAAVRADHGNAAAADADDQKAAVDQTADRCELDDLYRLGRGDHPPPVLAVGQTVQPRSLASALAWSSS